MTDRLCEIRRKVLIQNPLIHAITNPISINLCANAVLAAGGRPIMAEHPSEVSEITGSSHALLLNLGNITDTRMKSMKISAETAKKLNIPIVLDTVGVACSSLRYAFASELMSYPLILKGNYSEIRAMAFPSCRSPGVDNGFSDISEMTAICLNLAKKYGCIVLASGAVDIISDGKQVLRISNGTPTLSVVTGTGCMLGVLCALFCSVSPDIYAAATAAAMLGISGEKADIHCGNGSFQINLIDRISLFSDNDMKGSIKIEEI